MILWPSAVVVACVAVGVAEVFFFFFLIMIYYYILLLFFFSMFIILRGKYTSM